LSEYRNIDPTTLSILLSSLHDVQNAIRAYDTKAQIVSLSFIFSLGLITTVGALVPGNPKYSLALVIVSWLLGVAPVIMFGYVLYPSRSMAPKLGSKTDSLQRSYYLSDQRYHNLDEYIEAFDKSDWKVELIYEIQKNSLLRDMKRKRFVWALSIAGISFSLMFIMQLLRSIEVI
jgi:hypothetical protein|tara:strand:- start:562 stop:1086 length:525 start_codon:yes stop_codon:yes gene_type:complete